MTTPPDARPRTRRGFSLKRREMLWAYAFLAVPLLFFCLVRFWPALQSFRLSLFTWHVNPEMREFVGLGYYQAMLSDARLHRALLNTVLYTVIIVPTQLILGLSIAMLLNRVERFRGIFRAIYFAPYITPAAAIAWVWGWMYSVRFGIFNNALIEWSIFVENIGLPFLAIDPQPFLTDPSQALPAVAAVVVWQQLGFQVVIFLAGLQGVPRIYQEAAAIDGANAFQRFWRITLPLLNPVMVFSVIISTIYSLQLFDQVVNINFTDQGGPLNSTLTIALYMYQEAFSRFRLGYASAVTVLLFVLILVVTLVQYRLTNRKVEY